MYTFYPFWLLHTECLLILTIWSYCNVTKNCWGYSLGVNIMGPWSWWEQESQIYLDSWYPCGHSPIPSDYNMVEYFSNILHPFNLQIYNLISFNQFFITPPPLQTTTKHLFGFIWALNKRPRGHNAHLSSNCLNSDQISFTVSKSKYLDN